MTDAEADMLVPTVEREDVEDDRAEVLSLAPPPGLPVAAGGRDGRVPGAPGGSPPARRTPSGPPPGVPAYRSTYLDYLPGIFSDNDFLGRYLLIMESILGPITRTVDNIPHTFDPGVTPTDLLGWLGGWLGLALDDRWPEARRRELVRSAAALYSQRGTRRGLREFVRLYTGFEPEIIEPTLAEVSANRNRAFRFTVRVLVPRDTEVDRAFLQEIVDLEKPAFAAGRIEIVEIDAPSLVQITDDGNASANGAVG
jgi:phage tail-like protein